MSWILRRAEDPDRLVEHEIVSLDRFLQDTIFDSDLREAGNFHLVIGGSLSIDEDLALNEANPGVALTDVESFGDEVVESHKVTK